MAARNRRGRGYIETLPSGSYRAVVPCGMDPLTGRRRNLRETTTTSAEAEVALTKLQRQVDENKHPKSAIPVAEAIERWLEVVKLEETTRDRYEDLIRLYILPKLGDMQAGKVDAELLERLYARLERCRSSARLDHPRATPAGPCRPAPPARFTSSSAAPSAWPSGGTTSASTPPNWPRHPHQRRPSPTRRPPPKPPPC